MAKFVKIKRSAAPNTNRSGPKLLQARMREYDGYVNQIAQLDEDEAVKLVPEKDETPRSLLLRLARAARRNGVSIQATEEEGVVFAHGD